MTNVAVIGAAGQTGRPLLRALASRGARVTAIVRRDAGGLAADDVRLADLADQAALASAVEGADVLHFIPPLFDDREEAFAATVLRVAEDAGIARIGYHSVLHAPTPAMPHHARKARVEAMVRDSRAAWTIVQPAMYTTTPFVFLSADRRTLAPPFSLDTLFTMPNPDDLAAAVATILTRPGHDHATYELAGCEVLSFRMMAPIMAAAFGHPVAVQIADCATFLQRRAVERGRTPRQTDELAAMLDHYDRHGLHGNGGVLGWLLGRPPIDFAAAIRRQMT